MFNKKSAREPLPGELIGMIHAVIASWQSPDPYYPNGAAILDGKDQMQAIGWSRLMDKVDKNIAWDSSNIYQVMLRAEQDLHKKLINFNVGGTWVFYCTCLPHPECLKSLIEAGVTKIVYGPQKSYGIDKNSRKICESVIKATVGYSGSLEPFKSNLNFLVDKIRIMKNQVPAFFD